MDFMFYTHPRKNIKMFKSTSVSKDEFDSPLHPFLLNSSGVFLTLIGVTCFLSNAFLVVLFKRFKKLQTPLNVLIVVVTLSNLIGTLQFPFVIYSNFKHRYVYIYKLKLLTSWHILIFKYVFLNCETFVHNSLGG